MKKDNLYIVFITVPSQEVAKQLSKQLVTEHFAACVNIVPNISSIYKWEGKLETSEELLLVVKTLSSRYQALEQRVTQLHPYDTPEIVALNACEVAESYYKWALGNLEQES